MRFLVIRLEGLDGPLDPTLYFDSGGGFSEAESRALQPAEQIGCIVALHHLSDVRRIRLDPAAQPARFWLSVVAAPRLRLARKLAMGFLGRKMDPARATLELVDGREWGVANGGNGLPARPTSLEHHFRHVVALGSLLPMPAAREEAERPLVSLIVPIFNAPPHHLDQLLASVTAQEAVPHELILSDDGSTSGETRAWLDAHRDMPALAMVQSADNRGIAAATNAALAVARGVWVGLVDHDDALAPHALLVFAHAIARRPDARFLYTDEVIADAELRPIEYFVKPAFDPVLLSGVNYINHLCFYRRDRLQELGGLESGFQGSQDYDLLLRYLDGLSADQIVHIPYPAYLWRRHDLAYSANSRAVATENARRALARHYRRHADRITVAPALLPDLHRVCFDVDRAAWPRVSVVIPNRDAFAMISSLLDGLAEATDYPALDIIVIDNGSTDARVLKLYERCKRRFADFRLCFSVEDFNFSRAVNRGIAMASGDFVLLLNSDIEIVEPGWLKEMVNCFAYPATGIVGARLLYANRRIQHAGVIVGLGGLAGHWFVNEPASHPGPMGRLTVRQSFSAVTGAAMLISRACLAATGAFDEDSFAISYNDVDFCLRAKAQGFRVVWTPFATLIHHESASRGSDERPENIVRFQREQRHLRERHGTMLFEDASFSPWYSRDRSNPIVRFLVALPNCR
ncbi:MAG TPA: glycosyltransferase family 2 protein [Xanthobacteraceae bacterium]|nr:glycosyltransferase family 2 protein [Xanthobacteraceae bacterium]